MVHTWMGERLIVAVDAVQCIDWIIESSPTNNEYAVPAGNYVEHYL